MMKKYSKYKNYEWAEVEGKYEIECEDAQVRKEILKLFKREFDLGNGVILSTDFFEESGNFHGSTIGTFKESFAHLYEWTKEEVDWKLLEHSWFSITLKYIESSTEETGDFIRKITTVIEHMAGEQIKLPRIQDTSYEEGRMTWANQLRYGLRKDLNDLLQDYLEWKRSEDVETAEDVLQMSLMCDEIDGLELYYGKPLKEVYQEEIINKGYDCPEYRYIFMEVLQ